MFSIMIGAGLGLFAFIFVPSGFAAPAAAGVGAFMPFLYLKHKRSVRMKKFEEQFPEAVDLIARAMRAGHAFPTGLKMAADELAPPAGAEFKLLYERQNFGAQLPDALRTFAERIPSLDARFFVIGGPGLKVP
jgi:tight adherence protein B